MKKLVTPGVLAITPFIKGARGSKASICIKNPDTHFLFNVLGLDPDEEQDPVYGDWLEYEGEITFFGNYQIGKNQAPAIHDGMGVCCNTRRFDLYMSHYGGMFERPRPIALLWLKTTGKNEGKYDNEYQFENLNKMQCYKIARFLRESGNAFSPALNDYLFLRCGLKFDLDLVDVEVVSFNDTKGQGSTLPHEPFDYGEFLDQERGNYLNYLPPRLPLFIYNDDGTKEEITMLSPKVKFIKRS